MANVRGLDNVVLAEYDYIRAAADTTLIDSDTVAEAVQGNASCQDQWYLRSGNLQKSWDLLRTRGIAIRRQQRGGGRHRHRRGLHPRGSQGQYLGQHQRDPRQRHRRRRQRLHRRRLRRRSGDGTRQRHGRQRPRHPRGKHHRRLQQPHWRGGSCLQREAHAHQGGHGQRLLQPVPDRQRVSSTPTTTARTSSTCPSAAAPPHRRAGRAGDGLHPLRAGGRRKQRRRAQRGACLPVPPTPPPCPTSWAS